MNNPIISGTYFANKKYKKTKKLLTKKNMNVIVLSFYRICKQLMNLVFKKRNYNPIFIKEKGGDGEIILAAKAL